MGISKQGKASLENGLTLAKDCLDKRLSSIRKAAEGRDINFLKGIDAYQLSQEISEAQYREIFKEAIDEGVITNATSAKMVHMSASLHRSSSVPASMGTHIAPPERLMREMVEGNFKQKYSYIFEEDLVQKVVVKTNGGSRVDHPHTFCMLVKDSPSIRRYLGYINKTTSPVSLFSYIPTILTSDIYLRRPTVWRHVSFSVRNNVYEDCINSDITYALSPRVYDVVLQTCCRILFELGRRLPSVTSLNHYHSDQVIVALFTAVFRASCITLRCDDGSAHPSLVKYILEGYTPPPGDTSNVNLWRVTIPQVSTLSEAKKITIMRTFIEQVCQCLRSTMYALDPTTASHLKAGTVSQNDEFWNLVIKHTNPNTKMEYGLVRHSLSAASIGRETVSSKMKLIHSKPKTIQFSALEEHLGDRNGEKWLEETFGIKIGEFVTGGNHAAADQVHVGMSGGPLHSRSLNFLSFLFPGIGCPMAKKYRKADITQLSKVFTTLMRRNVWVSLAHQKS